MSSKLLLKTKQQAQRPAISSFGPVIEHVFVSITLLPEVKNTLTPVYLMCITKVILYNQ